MCMRTRWAGLGEEGEGTGRRRRASMGGVDMYVLKIQRWGELREKEGTRVDGMERRGRGRGG